MREPDPIIAETGKQFVLAGILWIIGSVIFIIAAYKLYNPDDLRPICPPPEPECPPGYHRSMF